MRSRPLLAASVIALAAGLLGVAQMGGRAQEQNPHTLYVSGMSVGKRRSAVLRVTNSSQVPGDRMRLHYTVRSTRSGAALSLPGAGDGVSLFPGETVEIDLGAAVDAQRAVLELPSFAGSVQVVAFGTGGPIHPFGPEWVTVEALQTDGRATYGANVEWRPLDAGTQK